MTGASPGVPLAPPVLHSTPIAGIRHHIIGTLLILLTCTATAPAQDDPDERFDRIADRYWQILHARPRHGTAFDRWYQHYQDAGRGAELVEFLETREEEDPDFATHMLLGFVYERHNRLDDALSAYQSAEQLDAEQYVAPAALGLLHVRGHRFPQAADCLSRALQRDPPAEESLTLYEQLGRTYLRLGEREQALLTFQKMVEAFPGDAGVLRQAAELLTEEGQFSAAISHWEQIAALPDEDPYLRIEARTSIAALRLRLGRREDAIALLDETLDDVLPESWIAGTIWEQLEQAFLDAEDPIGLAQFCRHRLERRPEDLDTRQHLAHALSLAGDRDQSIREYRQAVASAPTRRDIREAFIHELVIDGRIDEALEQSEYVARANPRDADALSRLGELQLRRGRAGRPVVEQAVDTWKQIADLKPEDPLLAVNVAELCRRTIPEFAGTESGDEDGRAVLLRETAEQFYRAAVARAPADTRYLEYLGEFLHEQGRREEAVETWLQIASGPDATAEDWHHLAELYGTFQYLDEAVAAVTNAIEQRPGEFAWRLQRMELLLRQENWDAVETHLEEFANAAATPAQQHRVRQVRMDFFRAADRIDSEISRILKKLRLNTATADEMWMMGLLYTDRRQFTTARNAFQALLTQEPDNLLLLRDYFALLETSRNLQEAVEQLRRIIKLDPQHRLQDWEKLALLEVRRKDYSAAREAVRQLIQLAPDRSDNYVLQARVEFAAGDVEAELSALRRAVQLAPQDVALRDHFAQSLRQHEQIEEALEQFWRCLETAEDPGEQRSIVSAMCSTVPDARGREQIVARLRRLRTQREDTRPLTFCLVEALRSSENYESARRELRQMLNRRPDDPGVLHELAALSALESAWNEAADYQQRIVELTGSPVEEDQLLDYCKLAGRNDDIVELTARQLPPDDPAPYLDEISGKLRNRSYQDALNVARVGLSRIPDNWQLQFQAAATALLLGDDESAAGYFESAAENARQLVSASGDASPETPGAVAMHELQTAKSAYSNLTHVVSVRDGRIQPAEEEYPGRMPLPDCPDNARDGRVAAVIGAYVAAAQRGRAHNWIRTRYETGAADPRSWRHLIWVYAATGTLGGNRQFLESYMQRNPRDVLPHLARLSQNRSERFMHSLSTAERSAEYESLRTSFRWVANNQPAIQAEFIYNYGTAMLLLGDVDEAVSAFIDSLGHTSPEVRKQAAVALRTAGPTALRSVPQLTDCLADESVEVALEAAATLGTFAAAADAAVSALIEALSRDSLPLRREVAWSLGRIGDAAMQPLLSAAESDDARTRHGVALALYYLGPDAEPAAATLTRLADDSDEDVRRRARMTLDNLGQSAAEVPD